MFISTYCTICSTVCCFICMYMYGWYCNLTLATVVHTCTCLWRDPFNTFFLDILRPNRKYNLPFGRLDPHVVEGRRELLQYYLGVRINQNIHVCFSIYYIEEFVTNCSKSKTGFLINSSVSCIFKVILFVIYNKIFIVFRV